MLKKRIIPCLDIQNGRTVKGVNFVDIRDAGDPIALARTYAQQGADELVLLDISASIEGRNARTKIVEAVAREVNIPFTVGGGINSVADAKELIEAGADKISVNSAAIRNPDLIQDLSKALGSQCVVVAIDTKYELGQWNVYTQGGRKRENITTLTWVREAEKMGAGEILLTSMNNDGSKNGFAIDICGQVAQAVNIPVIASGGAGTKADFANVFQQTQVTGALAASVFHFGDIPIQALKDYLKQEQIAIR